MQQAVEELFFFNLAHNTDRPRVCVIMTRDRLSRLPSGSQKKQPSIGPLSCITTLCTCTKCKKKRSQTPLLLREASFGARGFVCVRVRVLTTKSVIRSRGGNTHTHTSTITATSLKTCCYSEKCILAAGSSDGAVLILVTHSCSTLTPKASTLQHTSHTISSLLLI